MSADAMDIDPISPSTEKKRKNKEKDRHSSKKRKHDEPVADGASAIDASQSKEKKKKKEKKSKHKGHASTENEDSTLAPNAEIQDEHTSSKSKKKKHHHHHRNERDGQSPQLSFRNEMGEEEEDASTVYAQSPSIKKSFGKASEPQLASTESADSSPFRLITSTLYLPLSPISISSTHALSSLLAEHISPLLLTYYPPFHGVILAYSDPSISSNPPSVKSTSPETDPNNPRPLSLAVTANEYGVLYVYLTATFLVFRPEPGQTLEGWINVQSEGFLGAVVHNLFSVGIERRRLPQDWEWVAPGQGGTTTANLDNKTEFDSDKENFRPLPASASTHFDLGIDSSQQHAFDEEEAAATGYFRTRSGRRVRGTIRFRVCDIDVIPGSEKDKGFLSLEGTMLTPEEEAKLVAEEKKKILGPRNVSDTITVNTPEPSQTGVHEVRMSGAVGDADTNPITTSEMAAATGADTTVTNKKKKEKKKSRN